MSAGDHSGSAEPHVPLASLEKQVMPPVIVHPAAVDCDGAQAASASGTSSPSGRQSADLQQLHMPESLAWTGPESGGGIWQGAIACSGGQEAHSSQHASPVSANLRPSPAEHGTAAEHCPSRPRCHETAPMALASQHGDHISVVFTTRPPGSSTASQGLPNSGLQNAGQVLEAAMASGNVQQLAAGIQAAVKALSAGSGAPAEAPQVTKVPPLGSLDSLSSCQPVMPLNCCCTSNLVGK